MRRIGLLGGMSWESTALYYRLVNEEVRERLGGFHSARLVLASVDFAEIEAMQSAGDWSAAGALLAAEARAVQAAGAECLVLCTNTMHKVADVIEAAVDIPLLHLADVTADAVRRAGLDKVALLGTRFTVEQPFYADRLRSHGIEVLVPDEPDRTLVRLHRDRAVDRCRRRRRAGLRDDPAARAGRGRLRPQLSGLPTSRSSHASSRASCAGSPNIGGRPGGGRNPTASMTSQ